jgi:hypothetical protein
MNLAQDEAWMLYCRHQPKSWLEIAFARGERRIQARFKVSYGRAYRISIFGNLLGEAYLLEAVGRNRRPEDKSESELVFKGTFEHEDGCSGDFAVRPRADGELMTLGVYGAEQLIKLNSMNRSWRYGPVEMSGIANTSLRLESGLNFSELVIPNHYAGVLRVRDAETSGGLPMITVLTTLVLGYEEILKRHYLTE